MLAREQKAHMKLLISTLRDGGFEQTTGYLKRSDSLCVLGLACEIFRITTEIGEWRPCYPDNPQCEVYYYFAGKADSKKTLPFEVARWYGFRETNPEVIFIEEDEEYIDALANLNDNGADFKRLADIIEENFFGGS